MQKIKDIITSIKKFFTDQSKLTYGLILMWLSVALSLFAIDVWGFETVFFVARPSLSCLGVVLAAVLVAFLVAIRVWMLSFYVIDPKKIVEPKTKRNIWLRDSMWLIGLATLPNAYFIYPYDSKIIAVILVLVAACSIGGQAIYKNYYAPVDGYQKKWFRRAMLKKTLPSFLVKWLPR